MNLEAVGLAVIFGHDAEFAVRRHPQHAPEGHIHQIEAARGIEGRAFQKRMAIGAAQVAIEPGGALALAA